MKNTFRAFIAIPLSDRVKAHLSGIQRELKKSGIKASWPKPAAMHLTLKFLGNMHIDEIGYVQDCMQKAAEALDPFDLSISGIGGFPSAARARVIWAGVEGQKNHLISLSRHLEILLSREMNVKREKKGYLPHLTLARVKRPVNLKKIGIREFPTEMFCVSEFNFYESTLMPSGVKHEIIFSAGL